jgi:hypothetical protein
VGAKSERGEICSYVETLIKARVAWAASPEGRKQLGPGSPTVPGLQDLCSVRDFIHARGEVRKPKKS